MQTHRIIATLVVTFGCALTLSACNDTSKNAADRAARTTAALDPRVTTTPNATSTNTLPAAVPVPPAESSPVITGAIPAPATSAETPVGFAKSEAAGSDNAAVTPATAPATSSTDTPPSASTSSADEKKLGIDSPATNPLGTLSPSEQSGSMPMAAHGNNHSSPSLEQGRDTQTANAQGAASEEARK